MSGKMLEWIATQLDLPTEPNPGKSLIEIFEDHRVVIENHYGVISYNTEEIQIRSTFGMVSVLGQSLTLACMSKHRLVITGQIMQISICKGN